VEWIASKSWCTQKVGTWGPSALGRIQFQTEKKNPPHLTCCVPIVAGPQYEYGEYYQGGVYKTEYLQQLDLLGFGLSAFVRQHQVHDITWQFVEYSNNYPDSIRVPNLMIGGWYDHATEYILDFFNEIRASSPANVRDKHRLLMGPWTHSGIGLAQQAQLTYNEAKGWSDSLALLFFNYHLNNVSNGWDTVQYIKYFQMGENTWKHSASWPPAGVTPFTLYFHKDGSLNTLAPTETADYDSVIYDPKNPSPTIGGSTLRTDLIQGPCDQAPVVESRNDILTYTTATLGANVVMKGKSTVTLKVSSDRKDTDFAIRLTDVYPDGRSMLVMDGTRRLRFRNGYAATDTSCGVTGQIYNMVIELPTSCITFLAGHKIRVDITSSNYPRFDCNLNNGGQMLVGGDSLIATNKVYMNSVNASSIQLYLVDFSGSVKNNQPEQSSFEIYPNPAKDFLNISCKNESDYLVEISDITGKILISENYNITKSGNKISIANLAAGNYIIRISDNNSSYSKKLIINN
jgi:predicted acyl esterase